ncbi:uncharacterized protein K460DRAFT_394652 [Cucurbitaria berberidis CBS 394.84]|uniref:Rhodopsin domain-containing protein n=1 Tax=Cucurbitaria berberidis CBS 394.84 TaxID=1168544 RepID=A0A9P4GG74_9PLEO|nr:uncharacterized protein K460DRAFT_394652 [Cucurbitaria berberidis CBS 394.84]KAF1844859.1 hypothetical protein K460DRAFT_394652 [Cucurbitaria berberidis CBS 394.84]
MRVDARGQLPDPSSTVHDKGPFILAIAVTLVSLALLTFSLRIYTRGRLLRSFGIDDYMAAIAASCLLGALITIACLVNLGFGKQSWSETSDNNPFEFSPLIWSYSLLIIIAIGLVKLSVAFFILRIFERRYCRHFLYVIICLLVALTPVWFGSTLLQCIPVAATWNTSTRSGARCMSRSAYMTLSLVNNSLNAGTDLLLVILVLPIACSPSLGLTNRVFIILVLSLGLIACAAAIEQMRLVFNIWKTNETDNMHDMAFVVWSIVELATALLAASLPTLKPLGKSLLESFRKRQNRTSNPIPSTSIPHSNYSSYHSRYSSRTVIYRPNTAYLPSLSRFHDDVSNLDFDIETRTTRTRTQTMRTRTTHSRNVSDWSQFSGFTYYTTATEPPDLEHMTTRSAGASVTELEDIVKALGLGRDVGREPDVLPAITAMDSTLPHERGDGVELVDMERDIGDDEIRSSDGGYGQEERSMTGIDLPNARAV